MVNYDPAAIWVAADSKWNKMEDLVNEIKANPGKLRASGTGTGGIWHLSICVKNGNRRRSDRVNFL